MKVFRVIALLFTLVLASCGSAGSNMQFFNASPDGPSLDVLFDNDVVLFGIDSETFVQYRDVNAGATTIRLNETGTSRTLGEIPATLVKNVDYTLIALGSAASLAPLLLTDDNTIDQESTAKLRFVHASPSVGALDFYVTTVGADLAGINPLLSDLAFGEVSEYLIVGPNTYQIRATLTGTKTVAIDSGNFVLSASQVRTGVAVDKSGGGLPPSIVFLPDRL
ncbi:MAG TPA: DUF4397 domain-containing protein [bacterium]|nr:DUF4397 domain-containing protein [bacterium]